MDQMIFPFYAILVLTNFPTISADLKRLNDDQFNVRQAATEHLKTLPGWTVYYFKDQSRTAKDREVRIRCTSVQAALERKWEHDLLKPKADLILALHPAIPRDIKTLAESTSFEKRFSAAIRLRSLLGFTAPYFKYYAQQAAKPEVKSLCERIYNRKEKEWKKLLASEDKHHLELHIFDQYQKNIKSPLFWVNILSNLSKLDSEDLKLVEAQKHCPICPPGLGPDPLGSCGVPVKITLKGQTVFLCSKDRIKQAQAEPDKTLANVKRNKRVGCPTKKQIEQYLEKVIRFTDDN